MNIRFNFKVVRDDVRVTIPYRATAGSAGYDLFAALKETVEIAPGEWAKIPTGIALEIPNEFMEAQVRSRSGLAAMFGVSVLNSPGTIDSDFRGEISVILMNHSGNQFYVKPGMKIAQLVFARVELPDLVETYELSDTERGEGGFGSTGV